MEIKQYFCERIQDFPRGAPTPKVSVLTYFFGRKLHENERIWTPGGGGVRIPGAPFRSTTGLHIIYLLFSIEFVLSEYTYMVLLSTISVNNYFIVYFICLSKTLKKHVF